MSRNLAVMGKGRGLFSFILSTTYNHMVIRQAVTNLNFKALLCFIFSYLFVIMHTNAHSYLIYTGIFMTNKICIQMWQSIWSITLDYVTIEKWHRIEGDNVRIKTIMRIRYTCAHIILTIHVQIFSTLHIITEISSNMKVRFTLCFWK